MSQADALDRGQESFHRRAWGNAYTQLSAAAEERPLELEVLEPTFRSSNCVVGRISVCLRGKTWTTGGYENGSEGWL